MFTKPKENKFQEKMKPKFFCEIRGRKKLFASIR